MEIYTEFVTTVLNGLITIVITTLTKILYHFRKINKLINKKCIKIRRTKNGDKENYISR